MFDLDPSFLEGLKVLEPKELTPNEMKERIKSLETMLEKVMSDLTDEKNKWAMMKMDNDTETTDRRRDGLYIMELLRQIEDLKIRNAQLIETNEGFIASNGSNGEKIVKLNKRIKELEAQLTQKFENNQNVLTSSLKVEMGVQPSDDNKKDIIMVYDAKQKKWVKGKKKDKPEWTYKIMNQKRFETLVSNFELMSKLIIPNDKERLKILQELKAKDEAQIAEMEGQIEKLYEEMAQNETTFANNEKLQKELNEAEIEELREAKDAEIASYLEMITEKDKQYQELTDKYAPATTKIRDLEEKNEECLKCIVRYEKFFNPKHRFYQEVDCVHPRLREIQLENEKLWFFQKWFKKNEEV
jgi:hypothetical protein